MTCQTCLHSHPLGTTCMRRVPLFAPLSAQEISEVQRLIVQREYKKGEFIIHPLKVMQCLFIINKGKVKVIRPNKDGKEQILYVLTVGEFFGEQALFSRLSEDIMVEALEDSGICTISKAQFQALLQQMPQIAIKMIEVMSHRLTKMEELVESLGINSVDKRVFNLIEEYSIKFGRKTHEGILIQLPLSREEMANHLGITRETISRKLAKYQDEGKIKLIGHKQILLIHK
ncbi:MAG: Crp/Fnr family transcriptional regulator [Erysipelotrichaceae bacterium]|nr:Crp/Fnr family transcriptional regulator [Erysipelotrichaceae bacterium]MDP3304963.1 Crp/Fnr family transcriptional regulator [Erysipelotrichaceae bacterium]